ncbi:MAG TPA: KTSC domain-containing protein [Bryobacteraceae bacterium]|jgi:hypothetical protein|nr:KTSC domain-containing protein [Bryobacteraceae bacterium]
MVDLLFLPDNQSLLEVEFRDGARYRFFAAPASCFQQLLASDSKGRHFNNNIRNRFGFQCVADRRPTETEEN